MEEFLDQRSRRFQKKGWNTAGARLLAVSSWIAHKNKIQAKRKFADFDVILVLVLIILAFIFITNSTILFTLVFLSVLYVVKMFTKKINLEDLLESLSRDTLKILVLQLLDFCELRNLDHESIPDLSRTLLEEQTSKMMLLILFKFVSENTKYYTL